ncbi:MAG: leucyl/phenylalanyl-tRNA--protein transferase [Pseudomonadota bacterium]
MTGIDDVLLEITPQVLLKAYACGIFPMAESAADPGMFWVEPEMRGILPLENFHVSRSLRKTLRKTDMQVFIDRDFSATIKSCAEIGENRKDTWINPRIQQLYIELHELGHAHSFETYLNDELVGGLYGVRLGRAFFGESMFSRKTDASKIALVHLVFHMINSGFTLLDTQFTTKHLESFGVVEIPRDDYHDLLDEALQGEAHFRPEKYNQEGGATSDSILQLFNQIS